MIADADLAEAGAPVSAAILPRLRPLIAATRSPLSEYSLANLFLFRARHRYRFLETPIPHVRGTTYDGERHVLPLAPLDAETCMALLDTADCIGPLGAEAGALAARFALDCAWNDADSDYVYSAERLATLADAKAKRAQARAFERDSRPRAIQFDAESAQSAREVLDGWFADVGRAPDDTDLSECREAIDHAYALGLEGLIVFAGGGPVAFLLAGPGADSSRIVHFAKGRRACSGAYPWMFARYASACGAMRINFEQDLGKPGFAQAKRAFTPLERLRKYRLRQRRT